MRADPTSARRACAAALLCGALSCAAPNPAPTAAPAASPRAQEPVRDSPGEQQPDAGGPGFGLFGTPLKLEGQPSRMPLVIDVSGKGDDAGDEQPAPRDEIYLAPLAFRDTQIGFGGVLVAGWLFPTSDDPDAPLSTVAVGGFYSENDSTGGLGLGRFHLADDAWRVLAAGGGARIEYDFYGIGTDAGEAGDSVLLRTTYSGGEVEALGRVAPNLRVGPAVLLYDVSTRATDPSELPDDQPADAFDGLNTGLGLHLERDTRDRVLSPRAGTLLRVGGDFYGDTLGGDFDFQVYTLDLTGYPALDERSVLAWRLHTKLVSGDAPFYSLAQYDARGYQKGRYRDDFELGGELEYRRHLGGRFGAVAFAGLGQVAPGLDELDGGDWLPSGGVGLRFQLTESSPLNYALDVAFGRDETILYLSVGESF